MYRLSVIIIVRVVWQQLTFQEVRFNYPEYASAYENGSNLSKISSNDHNTLSRSDVPVFLL